MALNARQDAFINEYMKDFNATRAATVAGYSATTAASIGAENLTKPHIAERIAQRLAALAAEMQLEIKDVVRDIASIIRADPRDLMEFRRIPCRYCHGDMHLYQFTPQEMRDAFFAA